MDANGEAARLARIIARIGWLVFFGLATLAYLSESSLLLAVAVGVTWIAYYYWRFTQPNEKAASTEMGIFVLGSRLN